LSYKCGFSFWKMCMSGSFITFWVTKFYTPRIITAVTAITVFETQVGLVTLTSRLPSSTWRTHLALLWLPFILRCRCLRRDSVGCYTYLTVEHLPSLLGASPTFQHSRQSGITRSDTSGLGLLSCPSITLGGQTGMLPLYAPFSTRIYRRQAAVIFRIYHFACGHLPANDHSRLNDACEMTTCEMIIVK